MAAPAAGDAAVDGEGPGPLLGLGEGDRQQREGGRRHDGGEGALEGPGAEEHGRVLGQAAQGRGGGEADQADDEHPLAAEVVGDAAAEEQQPGEGQGVGGQHPLAVGRRDVQGTLGRGQGDDDHGGVEHHHELGHGDDGQRPEALGVESVSACCAGQVLVGRSRVVVMWRVSRLVGVGDPVRWAGPRPAPSSVGVWFRRPDGLQSESEFGST